MAKVSDLVVLDRMAAGNKDIRLSPLPENLLNVRRVKAGGHVTIGVDPGCCGVFMNMGMGSRDFGAFLCIFNRAHFNEAKAELEGGILVNVPAEAAKEFDPAAPGARMHYVPDTSELERKYRYRLWMAYPDPEGTKYGDDGEMQVDGKDFLRAPLDKLEAALEEALLKKAVSQSKQTSDYDHSIHSNPDARAWAQFYCKIHPGADFEDIAGWFANAMMAMHDHLMNKIDAEKGTPVPLAPLPISDWPKSCDECSMKMTHSRNNAPLDPDDCAGCPNVRRPLGMIAFSRPGNPDIWPGHDPTGGYFLWKNSFDRFIISPDEKTRDVAWTGSAWAPVDGFGMPSIVQVCNFATEAEAHEYVASLNKQMGS